MAGLKLIVQYCTSGDLGSLIRKAQRSNTPLNEDKIWNIFLQIVQALHHCHWPNERSQSSTTGRGALSRGTAAEKEARYQVLHRDLKPENGQSDFRISFHDMS
jgi:NIMA (never in mitosis gene a)-related kinase